MGQKTNLVHHIEGVNIGKDDINKNISINGNESLN